MQLAVPLRRDLDFVDEVEDLILIEEVHPELVVFVEDVCVNHKLLDCLACLTPLLLIIERLDYRCRCYWLEMLSVLLHIVVLQVSVLVEEFHEIEVGFGYF